MTGILPRRGASAPERAAALAPPWTEERIAELVEDAACRIPAATGTTATVRVHGGAARIDLDLVVDHGTHLATAAEAVRRLVAARVEACTGLTVEEIILTVVDLRLPDQPPPHRRCRAGGDAWAAT
ncbi:Asp23 family, cell envelope-related function [Micromonospora viridifaciens]|uniref:Asp23 family, cell envelope-related function n=1 Tax=Micromonospora viridifaciens TaxID=1881 RepID=A0A1C4YMS4_MICVI|nr:Asp23/Gls24 family envelope stress response protein [Micromonospora viridifaciens]SCF22055.1 Asp23 family, cell envelope-related function [Micromonospora viridifaciens]